LSKKHPFYSQLNPCFKYSPLLLEKITYAGQLSCYVKAVEVVAMMMDISISGSQAWRVTNYHGQQMGERERIPQRALPVLAKDECLYAEVDGSMILTREKENPADSGWKEVKVGRIFKAKDDCVTTEKQRGAIVQSQYLAHLGEKQPFVRQMDELIDSFGALGNRLIFISDGATWIKNWQTDIFPEAIQIIDYFHVVEHIYEFSGGYFNDGVMSKAWVNDQELLLQDSQADQVIENIKGLPTGNMQSENNRDKLIDYLMNNLDRMDYKRYRKLGAGIIGSGAIESAHRTVVQERLKLSGQRWNKKGAQNVLNLRVAHKSGTWNRIVDLIKNPNKLAA
jgi:hypothetical protein